LWSDSRHERIVAGSENIKYFCYMKRNSSWEFFFNFVYFERDLWLAHPESYNTELEFLNSLWGLGTEKE
jgi:hypothetical protein